MGWDSVCRVRRVIAAILSLGLLGGCGSEALDPSARDQGAAPTPSAAPTPDLPAYAADEVQFAVGGELTNWVVNGDRINALARSGTSALQLVASPAATLKASQAAIDANGRLTIARWTPAASLGACDSLRARAGNEPPWLLVRACAIPRLLVIPDTIWQASGQDLRFLVEQLDQYGRPVADAQRVQYVLRSVGPAMVRDVRGDSVLVSGDAGVTTIRARAGSASVQGVSARGVAVVVDTSSGIPLIVSTATGHSGEIALRWAPVPQVDRTVVLSRRPGEAWQIERLKTPGRYAVWSGLPEGEERELKVVGLRAGVTVAASRAHRVQVRHASPCDGLVGTIRLDVRVFCSSQQLTAWAAARGLSVDAFVCGRQVIQVSEGLPDCVYRVGGERLGLLRAFGTSFQTPSSQLSPAEVRGTLAMALTNGERDNVRGWFAEDPGWSQPLPEADVGQVQEAAAVQSWELADNFVGRVSRFEPRTPSGRVAIFHEGHGGPANQIGADIIDSLLQSGWIVYSVSMPQIPHVEFFDRLASARWSPLTNMLYGVAQVVEHVDRFEPAGALRDLVLIGRSGGGWTTLLYAALDDRVARAVVVAGFGPLSERLADQAFDLGDWEQWSPDVFGLLGYTDLMLAAGTRGLLLTYSTNDPCCFRFHSSDPFILFARFLAPARGSPIDVFVDDAQVHGLSPVGFRVLAEFLGMP